MFFFKENQYNTFDFEIHSQKCCIDCLRNITVYKKGLKLIYYCQPQAKAKAKAMPGRLYIHTRNKIINNKTTFVSYLNSPRKGCPRGMEIGL